MRLKAHWPSILEEARQGRLDLVREARHVDPAGPLVTAARSVGTCFGD